MSSPSPEDFLKQDVGALVASLLFQLAVLKSENARLLAERNGQPAPAPPARSAA